MCLEPLPPVSAVAKRWAQSFSADDWVSIDGSFASNPSTTSLQPVAVIPDAVTPIEQPREPYLF